MSNFLKSMSYAATLDMRILGEMGLGTAKPIEVELPTDVV
jgi:hypothetical protein